MGDSKSGEQFIHGKDSSLHTSQPVEHAIKQAKRRGESVSQKPADKLAAWFKVLERTHMGHRDNPRVFPKVIGTTKPKL
jgi:hypothetical protein